MNRTAVNGFAMQPQNHLQSIRKLSADMPACDYLAGLRRFREHAASLTEDERSAFNRAFAGALSCRETCSLLLINLAADLGVHEAGPVLLAHVLSSGYRPTAAGAPCLWTDLERAAIARALGALGVGQALPVLKRHLADYRSSAGRPGWFARILRRNPASPDPEKGVPQMTDREAGAIEAAIAQLEGNPSR